MKFGTVIYTKSVPDALGFYERAFGLKTKFYDPEFEYAEFEIDGDATLALASHRLGQFLMPDSHRLEESNTSPSGSMEIAFVVEDVEIAFERAVAASAKILATPKLMPWGATVAYLQCPEGTLIGLSSPVPQSNNQ